jgi:hypothetical protein
MQKSGEMALGGVRLRGGARPFFRQFADVVMMAAAVAFAFQAAFIAQSAAGTNGHYDPSLHRHANIQVVTHAHADGTIHRHAVESSARALSDHLQEPGCPCCWNTAIVVGVLPLPVLVSFDAAPAARLAIPGPARCRGTEPDGPSRPPSTPGIA